MQHRAAFFLMKELLPPSRRSISGDRSRAISAEQMLPSAHSASPTVYWFLELRSFFSELVTSISTSCRSSRRIISPRYPILCISHKPFLMPIVLMCYNRMDSFSCHLSSNITGQRISHLLNPITLPHSSAADLRWQHSELTQQDAGMGNWTPVPLLREMLHAPVLL